MTLRRLVSPLIISLLTLSLGLSACGGDDESSSTSNGDETGDGDGDGDGDVGDPPTAKINHPGDGEERKVNVDVPMVGVGNDTEDGALTGEALQWTSSLEGDIGSGENFQWKPTMLGDHTITLTVTDSDDNTTEDSVNIKVVQ